MCINVLKVRQLAQAEFYPGEAAELRTEAARAVLMTPGGMVVGVRVSKIGKAENEPAKNLKNLQKICKFAKVRQLAQAEF